MKIHTPLTKDVVKALKAGDNVTITGVIYSARDAAHKRMLEEYEKTGRFPFDIRNAVVYYMGPSPAKPGEVIGSAGPTTSGRMDSYAPALIELGLTGMIGKGPRKDGVAAAMKRFGAVYLAAVGGAGALLKSKIKSCRVIAYSDLGAEAVHELVVEDFPAVVAIDSDGNSLF
jgi:fumarate hydratase subunit beta